MTNTLFTTLEIRKLEMNIRNWTDGIQKHKENFFFGGNPEMNQAEIPKLEKRIKAAKKKLSTLK